MRKTNKPQLIEPQLVAQTKSQHCCYCSSNLLPSWSFISIRVPSAGLEAYKCNCFPQTIRDRNDLPNCLISSAEMLDDCVSKFASVVRARDYFFPPSQLPVNNCQFDVSPRNFSDSDKFFTISNYTATRGHSMKFAKRHTCDTFLSPNRHIWNFWSGSLCPISGGFHVANFRLFY